MSNMSQDEAQHFLTAGPLIGLYWLSIERKGLDRILATAPTAASSTSAGPTDAARPGASYVAPSIPRTFDHVFATAGQGFPVPYLRALAWNESRLQPDAHNPPPSSATGLLQVIDVVRNDFNQRHGTAYTRDDLRDPVVNVTVAASALRQIADSLTRNHPHVPNLVEDWDNFRWVELLTAGWNGGWSEAAGVGKVARYLEQRGIVTITVETIVDNAIAAGATQYLNRDRMRWWKQVARDYASARARDAQALSNAREIQMPPAVITRPPHHIDMPPAIVDRHPSTVVDAGPISSPGQLDDAAPISSPSQLDPSPPPAPSVATTAAPPSSELLDPYPDVPIAATPPPAAPIAIASSAPARAPTALITANGDAMPTLYNPAAIASAPTRDVPSILPVRGGLSVPGSLAALPPLPAKPPSPPTSSSRPISDTTSTAPIVVAGAEWQWPVPLWGDYVPAISDGWGSQRFDLDGTPRTHRGVDLMYHRRDARDRVADFPPGTASGTPSWFMPQGVPALAAAAGVVVYVGKTARGYAVQLAHDGGNWSTFYQHLARLDVQKSQTVHMGQPLGEIGGDPTQKPPLRHLHFEIWRGRSEAGAFDPQRSLLAWQRVRLMPLPDGTFYAESIPASDARAA